MKAPSRLVLALEANFGEVLGGPIRSAVVAQAEAPRFGWWTATGALGGLLVHLVVDVGSESVFVAVGAGVGVAFAMWLQDRNLRHDPVQPRSMYLAVAVTDVSLTVLRSNSLLRSRFDSVATSIPLDRVIDVTERRIRVGFWSWSALTVSTAEGAPWTFIRRKPWADVVSVIQLGRLG